MIITWSAPVPSDEVTGYLVRVEPGDLLVKVAGAKLGTTVMDLPNGVAHSVRVSAVSLAGEGPASAAVFARPWLTEAPEVEGLIVRYAQRVPVAEADGAATGSEDVSLVALEVGESIGFGMRTVEMSQAVSEGTAERIASELEASPEVLWAEPDYRVSVPDLTPSKQGGKPTTSVRSADVPGLLPRLATPDVSIQAVQSGATWGLDRIDQRGLPLNGSYGYRSNGQGVTAYVIDTGVSPHTEFPGRLAAGYSVIADGAGTTDRQGHGTHVAGTIGGLTYGVAKAVTLVPVRVLNASGSGTDSGVIAGLNWIVSNHAAGVPAVANMSLGGGASYALDQAVRAVIADGVTMVVAAGNEAQPSCNVSPARVAEAITVNASTSWDDDASYSNYGSCSDIYAPGSSITSAKFTGGSTVMSGTSMAAPHVAGAVARLLGANPGWSPVQVWDAIRAAATAVNFGVGAGDPNLLLFAQEGTEPPIVSAVSPTTGSTAGGTAVVITGSGLTGASSVRFGTAAAASFVVVSDSRIDAVSPPGAAGAVSLSVTGPGGVGVRPAAFTYAAPQAPVVSGVLPAGGAAAGGTAVVISGSGFTGASGVKFGAVAADPDSIVVVSDSRIEVDSPASPGGAAGAVSVSVTGPGGTGSRPAAFTYALPGRATGVVVVACRPDSPASAGCRADDLGGNRLKVSWVPPTSTGGAPLSGFSASAWSATSGGVEVASCSAGPSERSCTIEGLVNGVSYAVDVEAVNQVGDLSVSSPRTAGMPVGVPEQVVGAAVDPAVSAAGAVLSGVLRVSWSRLSSAEAGGLPVARYVATAWSASASGVKVKECTASASQTVAAPLFCDLTGMPIGTEVHVSVVATSVSGLSSASTDRIPGTAVATQPGAPTRATVVESGSSLRVSWTAPAGDSTAPAGQRVSSYEVSAWDSAVGGNVVSTCEVVAAARGAAVATSCLVPDLVNGITYWLDVTATNDEGPSTPSTPRVQGKPRGLAGAAGSVLAVPGFGQARVSWSAPASDGGWPVTSYTVRAFATSTGGAPLAGRSCTVAVPPGAQSTFTCVVTGLTNGTRYWFEVTGTNRLGSSAASARASAVPVVTVPDAPRSVAASGLDNRVQVSWLAPASSGGSSLTGYEATAWGDAGKTASSLGTCRTTAASVGAQPALVCEITGLSNGDPVFVDVVARNAVGDSASSSEVAGGSRVRVVPVDVPDAPAAPAVDSELPGELRVSWDVPGDDGGMDLTGYEAIAYTAASGGTILKTCVAGTSRTCLFTGLVNEVPAWVGVRARNGRGWSTVSERVQGVPQAVPPGSPTQVALTASSGQVKVSWRAPANNGGSPVTGYVATAYGAVSEGSNLGSCASSTTACTIAGLQNGTDVYVSVVASTLAGDGGPSGPRVKGTPRGVPMAPLAVAAEPARVAGMVIPGSLQVSWSPPLSDGGLAVSTYRAVAFTTAGGLVTAGSGCTVSRVGSAAVGTSCVISGLRNGVTYFVGVQAVNSGGVSLGSARDEGTPQAVAPGAPRSVQATVVTDPALVAPGNGVVQVTWSAPASDGGLPVTGYVATAFDAATAGSALDSCTLAGLPTTGSPCRLDNLEPGAAVFVEVTATNSVGTGPTSAQVTGGSRVRAVPVSLPDAPAPPALVVGNGRLAVSWVEPEQDGGTAVTGYTATAWTAESGGVSTGKTCALATSLPPSPLSCTISGLANDVTYWVSLVARNRIGTSPSSARTAGTPLATVPGVPRSVGASPQRGERSLTTVGPGSVRVSWQAPADSGGSPVTGYVVTAWTAANAGEPAGTCEVTATAPATPATACQVSGLDDGTDYWMSVSARNAVGVSDASPRASAVPRTYPLWPGISSTAGGNGRIAVTWEAGDDGGSPIARFAATAYSAASGGTALSTCSTTPSSLASAATSCIITGLANDTTYYIGVEAFNPLGGSARRPASPAPARTPATTVPDVPGAPTAVVVRPVNGSLVIGWAAPASNGGGRLAGYTATAWTDQAGAVAAATCTVAAVGTALPATGCTIPAPSAGSGLSLGTTYYVSVTARNSAGPGPASTQVPGTPAVAPEAPASVTATARNGALRISWAAPSVTGGAPVASYTARAWATTPTSGSPRCTTTASSLASADTTCTVTGLVNGLRYTIDVTATSAAGTSVPSATNNAVPTVVAPDAPTSVIATPADRSLSLAFVPGSNGGTPVVNHQYSLDAGVTWIQLSPADATSPVTIPGLVNGVQVTVVLRAVNTVGGSEPSSPVIATPSTTPQAPTIYSTTPGDRSVTIAFAPGDDGGSRITNHEYSINGGATWTPVTPPTAVTPITVTGLTNGTSYTFRIRARNDRGTGAASAPVTVTPVYTPAPEQASPLVQTWLVGKYNSPVVWPIQGTVDVTTGIQIWGCLVDQGSGTRLNGFTYRVKLLEDGRQIDERTGTAGSSEGRTTRACGTPSPTPPFADPYPGWWTGLPGIGAWASDSTPALRSGRTYTVVTEVVNNGMSGTTRMSFVATSSASRLPGAPSSMTVAPGDGSVTIGFTEPRSDHGYAIRNYEYSTDGGVTWLARTPASTSSPMTVTGLANGPTYQVRLRAVTDGGPGAAHPAVAARLASLPQQSLAISNQNRSTAADSSIQLTTSGGSGDGAVTFDVAGQGCALSGATLSTSIAPTTCAVTAMKSASLPFASVSSSPVTFAFSQVPQAQLSIANSVTAVSAGAPVAMMISGGSGSGAASFTALGDGCLMSGASLLTTKAPTTCSVTAMKAAGEIYSAAVSPTVLFSLSKAEQAPLVISNSVTEASANSTVGLSVSGGSGSVNASFDVVSGNGCWISDLTGLRTTVAPTTCMVTASNAANGIYLAATSAPVYFTFTQAPQAPLRVTNTTLGFSAASSVTLAWSGGSGTGAISYSVDGAGCSVSSTARLSTAIAPTTCSVTAARAASGIYASATSAPVMFTAVAVSQAVTFNTPSSLTILQTPYALTASSNRGLPVSITASTPSICAVSGTTLQLFASGSCVVTAAQQGSGIYAAASLTKTIDVTRVPQVISFSPASLLTMLQTPPNLLATTASGLPVSLSTTTPSVCTVTGTTLSLVSPGWCAVTAAQEGNAVYASASVTKTIQIAKESQVLVFAPPSALTMVQTPSTLSATATSGLPVSLTSTTPSVCSVTGTSLALLMAGTCSITANQAGNGDYSEATVSRSISITKAAQSISFSPALTAVATDDPVTLSATASSGLAVTFASSTPDACVVGGRQLVWIAGGLTCVVTASQAGNEVYSPVAVSRSIVVSKASQAVTFTFPVTSVTVTDPSESVTAAYSSSGLPVSVSSMTPTVCETTPGGVTWISGDADCVLLASQPGDSRYAPATANVRIRVNGLPQTISLNPLPASMTAVADPIDVKASSSSGLAVQISTSTPSICSVADGKITPLGGGTCTVLATQSGTAIYSRTVRQEEIQITKVATLIALDPKPYTWMTMDPRAFQGFSATITDADGKPLEGLSIRLRQRWISSDMGPDRSAGSYGFLDRISNRSGFVSGNLYWWGYSLTTWQVLATFEGTAKYLPQETVTIVKTTY